MGLKFGKNKSKELPKKQKKSKKKEEILRVAEKERVFNDVKMYRIMPVLLLFSVIFLIVGGSMGIYHNKQYDIAQGKVSMKKGEKLPLLYNTQENQDKGTLKLGQTILSKDHKEMAVAISYDDSAHRNLSAFGNEYKMYVVCKDDYPAQKLHLKYGFFGTDGNGVLQITSDEPFKNEAFVVLLVDKKDLATSSELTTSGNTVDDSDLTKSITAQLSEGSLNASSTQDANATTNGKKEVQGPATYCIRLNPYSSKKTNIDWGNDEIKLTDALFVKENLHKIQKQLDDEEKKIKDGKATLAEYDQRLAQNPNDQYAQQGKQEIQGQLNSLQEDYEQNKKQYDEISKAKLKKNILGKEADGFQIIRRDNLNNLQGS